MKIFIRHCLTLSNTNVTFIMQFHRSGGYGASRVPGAAGQQSVRRYIVDLLHHWYVLSGIVVFNFVTFVLLSRIRMLISTGHWCVECTLTHLSRFISDPIHT